MAGTDSSDGKLLQMEISNIDVTGNAKIIAKYDGESPAMSCAILPDENLAAIGWSNGTIEVLSTDTFEKAQTFRSSKNLPITSLTGYIIDDEKQLLLASYASGETIIWDIEEGEVAWSVLEDRQSLVNDLNCDFSHFAVGGSDAKINVYDTEEQKLVQVLQGSMDPDIMDGHAMRVFSVKFHPTRHFEVISGGWDDTVQFWDVREPFSRRKIRGPHICGDGIEFFEENKFMTASWMKKNPLQLWDYRTDKLIQNINPDDLVSFLYCCHYATSGSFLLVGGSHKNMLRVIDANTLKSLIILRNLPGAVYFARDLPKPDPYSLSSNICFCSDTSVYIAKIEV